MDRAIPDALVTGHEELIAEPTLPDVDDRHVLAAAIRCNASVIVTFNEKDFPAEVLSHYAMETQHPDIFAETYSIWITRQLSPRHSSNDSSSNTLRWESMSSWRHYFDKDSWRHRNL